jgi:transposase InsO family protein
MDFTNRLSKSEDRDVIMIIIDKFTKYGHFVALTHPITAYEVARVFLETIYKLHKLPVKVIIDRDPIFIGIFRTELLKKLGININLSTAYYPQTDGQSERLNMCLEQYLRCMASQNLK